MISEEQLLEVAGNSTFTKGKSIFRKGDVVLQQQSGSEISGIVSGTYDYRVGVSIKDNGSWRCRCNCPAFDYQAVCKHCVALVLAYNATLNNESFEAEETEEEQPVKKKSAPKVNKDALLQQYIQALPADTLHKSLYELLCDNKHQYARWMNKAVIASSKQDFGSLKKLVTKSLPIKDIWEYRKVAEYFNAAERAIADVLEAARQLPAEEHLKLIFSIYERLNKVAERVDDSGGFRFGVQYLLSDALPHAVARQTWNAQDKAQWLLSHLNSEIEGLPKIPGDFQLNDEEMSVFLQNCQQQFDAIAVNADIQKREMNFDLLRLGEMLLTHLPQAKEFSNALKIKSKMASSFHDLLAISQFCLDNHDEFQAEDWLLAAQKMATANRYQNEWDAQAIKVYAALGDTQKAWAIAWEQFNRYPGYYSWQRLQRAVEIMGWQPDTLMSDVESSLLARANSQTDKARKLARISVGQDDIVHFYLDENAFDKAVNWLDNNKAGEEVLRMASVKLASDFPEKAIQYCARALTLVLQQSNSQSYHEAVSILKKLRNQLPDNADIHQQFADLMADVILQNKRRPNMMALLRKEFEEYF
ncbi:SWIM zinc finger family protein [Paraneptunicella aestuarii]|uniref:SWIM zinc finger family protein n=1 Tax=Paraneptunicella aestuarii TaxID=2831148 RepID=UPI001E40DFC8|nr:SWIM zinc finger family protein [Paraneptunicella aestuarii]UAA38573.1 SWIM zinc finger family protein [Paraneptunicella aestuarii]